MRAPPDMTRAPAGAWGSCTKESDLAGRTFPRTPNSQTQAPVARLCPARHGDRYDVEFGGELLVRRSRNPEFDFARAVLAKGITGKVTVVDGKTGRARTTIDVEKAAKLTVREDRRKGPCFVQWKPWAGTARERVEGRSPAAGTRSADTPPRSDHTGAQL